MDLVTLGDHIYKKSEIIATLEKEERICKPANFPPEAPGRDLALATARDGTPVAVFCLLGRTFMRPVDCPVPGGRPRPGEAGGQDTGASSSMPRRGDGRQIPAGHHLKGRVSAVLGTHTHVATADEQILPAGTAFISDVGMTGPVRQHPGPPHRSRAVHDGHVSSRRRSTWPRATRAFPAPSSRWT